MRRGAGAGTFCTEPEPNQGYLSGFGNDADAVQNFPESWTAEPKPEPGPPEPKQYALSQGRSRRDDLLGARSGSGFEMRPRIRSHSEIFLFHISGYVEFT